MSKGERGFRYALEPFRMRKTWGLHQTQQALMQSATQLDQQHATVRELQDRLRHAVGEHQQDERLDLHRHAMTLRYVAQLESELLHEQQQLAQLLTHHEQLQQAVQQEQHFLDQLGEHKSEALKQYQRQQLQKHYREQDDDMMRREQYR